MSPFKMPAGLLGNILDNLVKVLGEKDMFVSGLAFFPHASSECIWELRASNMPSEIAQGGSHLNKFSNCIVLYFYWLSFKRQKSYKYKYYIKTVQIIGNKQKTELINHEYLIFQLSHT